MTTLFTTIREQLDIRDVAERYGVAVKREPNERGWSLCPFHNEKTPSLSFRDNRFHCFGCHEGGDAVDMVGKLYDISPKEAAQKIAHDFGLAAVDDVKAERRVDRNRLLREKWRELEARITDEVTAYTVHRERVDKWMPATEAYVIDLWQYANADERIEIYKNWKGVFERIGRKIREIRGNSG